MNKRLLREAEDSEDREQHEHDAALVFHFWNLLLGICVFPLAKGGSYFLTHGLAIR
jgi:hypothetical protein